MKLLTLKGRAHNVNIADYKIDWPADSNSIIQKKVKNFLYPYWQYHVVLEEFHLPGNKRLSIDFINITRNIAVEVDGQQHTKFHYFHNNNKLNFAAQIKRDLLKEQFCEINKIKLIRIQEDEIKLLSKEWIEEKFGISL